MLHEVSFLGPTLVTTNRELTKGSEIGFTGRPGWDRRRAAETARLERSYPLAAGTQEPETEGVEVPLLLAFAMKQVYNHEARFCWFAHAFIYHLPCPSLTL